MIKHPIAQIDSLGKLASLVEILMDRIAPGKQDACDFDRVAHFEVANLLFGEWSLQFSHGLEVCSSCQQSKESALQDREKDLAASVLRGACGFAVSCFDSAVFNKASARF